MSNLHEYSSESFPYFFRLWKYSRKVTRRWHFAAACFLPLDQNRPLLGKPGEEWWKSILPLHLLLPHTTTGQRLNPLYFVVWRMVTTLFVRLLSNLLHQGLSCATAICPELQEANSQNLSNSSFSVDLQISYMKVTQGKGWVEELGWWYWSEQLLKWKLIHCIQNHLTLISRI